LLYDPRADVVILPAIERQNRKVASLKGECLGPGVPLSIDDACRLVGRHVDHYYRIRLHSEIGYIAPAAKLVGREAVGFLRNRIASWKRRDGSANFAVRRRLSHSRIELATPPPLH
jgi:hypothetical protein